MTREEAKVILENDNVDGHVKGNARFMDAFWMAVDALSQEPCEEWIDYRDDGFVKCPLCGHTTNCEDNIDELHYCFYCGAELSADMRGDTE